MPEPAIVQQAMSPETHAAINGIAALIGGGLMMGALKAWQAWRGSGSERATVLPDDTRVRLDVAEKALGQLAAEMGANKAELMRVANELLRVAQAIAAEASTDQRRWEELNRTVGDALGQLKILAKGV